MRIFGFFLLGWAALTLSPVNAQQQPVKGAVSHQVTQGESMGTISRLYGVSPEEIRSINGGRRPEPGEKLWIPPSEHGWVTHLVLQGQNLESIAQGYGLPSSQLMQANGLTKEAGVKPGMNLILPRSRKPIWHETHRVGLQASRSGRPVARTADWVEVTLDDGRLAWVRSDNLVFEPVHTPSPTSMSFGKNLTASQKEAVARMVALLKADGFEVQADDIVNFMALETGGTFSPSVRSNGGAVGLAQFTDIAIKDMNRRRAADDQLSKERLADMTFEEQTLVVAEYLSTALERKKMQGRAVTGADLYSAIFAPKAIGAPMESTVYSAEADGGFYHRNASLDRNKDGKITKSEMVQRLDVWAERGEAQRG